MRHHRSALLLIALCCQLWLPTGHTQKPEPIKSDPFLVMDNCTHSGYMPAECVQNIKDWPDYNADSLHRHCIRITAKACDKLWVGVYWQWPADNWCAKKGLDLQGKGYTKITFEARAERDDLPVKFLVGNKECDSATVPDVVKYLTSNWQSYTISVAGLDLSNMRCPFGWAIDFRRTGDNPVFYLDNIRYE